MREDFLAISVKMYVRLENSDLDVRVTASAKTVARVTALTAAAPARHCGLESIATNVSKVYNFRFKLL